MFLSFGHVEMDGTNLSVIPQGVDPRDVSTSFLLKTISLSVGNFYCRLVNESVVTTVR